MQFLEICFTSRQCRLDSSWTRRVSVDITLARSRSAHDDNWILLHISKQASSVCALGREDVTNTRCRSVSLEACFLVAEFLSSVAFFRRARCGLVFALAGPSWQSLTLSRPTGFSWTHHLLPNPSTSGLATSPEHFFQQTNLRCTHRAATGHEVDSPRLFRKLQTHARVTFEWVDEVPCPRPCMQWCLFFQKRGPVGCM